MKHGSFLSYIICDRTSRSSPSCSSLPPLVELLLVQVPQLVHTRCLASCHTLSELHKAADSSLLAHSILRSNGLDLDNTDSWVVWATIVLAVTEVTDPCLESGRVVLVDDAAVSLDASLAGKGSPFAGVVQEAEVDVRVGLEVIGLARLGVGVEDEVNAVALLIRKCQQCYSSIPQSSCPTLPARAMHLLAMRPSFVLVAIMQNLHFSMNATRSSTLSLSSGSSRFLLL